MKSIEMVVFDCDITNKRERMIQNQKDMLMVHNQMSRLTFHQEVAQYAYCLDYDIYYRKKKDLTPKEKKAFLEGKEKMALLWDEPYVKLYRELKEAYDRMDSECRDYFKTINRSFREGLKNTELPNIFVYQGMIDSKSKLKLSRHIILGELHEAYIKTPNIVIHPMKDITSKRDARHFYSRISFQYLEQVSEDCNYDVKTKKLGRIVIHEGDAS